MDFEYIISMKVIVRHIDEVSRVIIIKDIDIPEDAEVTVERSPEDEYLDNTLISVIPELRQIVITVK